MSVIDTLVTDRSYADVQLWQTLKALGWTNMTPDQRAQWSAGLKGAYNATDLNRVQSAMTYLADLFNAYGYNVVLRPTNQWEIGQMPTAEDMVAYLSNLDQLRGALTVYATTPIVPGDMSNLTYQEANNIEQILVDLDQLLANMAQAWFDAGEIYCGEVT